MKIAALIVIAAIAVIALLLFQAWVLLVAWNLVMPALFPGVIHLSFLQAIAVIFLLGIVTSILRSGAKK